MICRLQHVLELLKDAVERKDRRTIYSVADQAGCPAVKEKAYRAMDAVSGIRGPNGEDLL